MTGIRSSSASAARKKSGSNPRSIIARRATCLRVECCRPASCYAKPFPRRRAYKWSKVSRTVLLLTFKCEVSFSEPKSRRTLAQPDEPMQGPLNETRVDEERPNNKGLTQEHVERLVHSFYRSR
jgi:hypothetical protein